MLYDKLQTSLAFGSGISAGVESYPYNIKTNCMSSKKPWADSQSLIEANYNTSGLTSFGSTMYSLSSQSFG